MMRSGGWARGSDRARDPGWGQSWQGHLGTSDRGRGCPKEVCSREGGGRAECPLGISRREEGGRGRADAGAGLEDHPTAPHWVAELALWACPGALTSPGRPSCKTLSEGQGKRPPSIAVSDLQEKNQVQGRETNFYF